MAVFDFPLGRVLMCSSGAYREMPERRIVMDAGMCRERILHRCYYGCDRQQRLVRLRETSWLLHLGEACRLRICVAGHAGCRKSLTHLDANRYRSEGGLASGLAQVYDDL
jgi:hypothetical protein